MGKTDSFEKQLNRLEEIVDILDRSEAPLEELLQNFEEGMKLAKTLRDFLDKAEKKIIDITKSEEIQKPARTLDIDDDSFGDYEEEDDIIILS